jgi:hypothetical protein
MGTRSLTFVHDEHGNAIVNMYRQFDGYISGHGAELSEFLAPMHMVNGYGERVPNLANGMGCLAAQMIAHFKVGVGGFYIHSVEETDCGQDYDYHVYMNKVVVTSYDEPVFSGTWAEFHAFCHPTETPELTDDTVIDVEAREVTDPLLLK